MPSHWDITELVLQASRTVFNRMGPHFLEAVYVRALEIECRKRGLRGQREVPVAVRYDGVIVGHYRADLLINGVVVLEAKAGERVRGHYTQLLNYLRCSHLSTGLLLNFGVSPRCQRITLDASHK